MALPADAQRSAEMFSSRRRSPVRGKPRWSRDIDFGLARTRGGQCTFVSKRMGGLAVWALADLRGHWIVRVGADGAGTKSYRDRLGRIGGVVTLTLVDGSPGVRARRKG